MNLSIMTWNTGLTEGKFEKNGGSIFEYVKNFLMLNNTVSVLQQIPYKTKQGNRNWVETELYKEFKKIFNEEEGYRILCNDNFNKGYVIMLTVIVTKIPEDKLIKSKKSFYPNEIETNRESAVTLIENDFTVLGIHAKNRDENKLYLNNLDCNPRADVILGDFNAGNYLESENKEIFNSILKEYVCICNMPTKEISSGNNLIRKSCIDHIFVKIEYITSCSKMMINDDINFSDHYPITFEINL